MQRLMNVVSVVVVSLLLGASSSQAGQSEIRRTFNLPTQYEVTVQTSSCTATPGPQISIEGEQLISGLRADTIFSNPLGIPGSESEVVVQRVVVPQNELVALPRQSVVGVMGNNPFLWLQLTDEKGRPLTSEIFLGRCDQGSFTQTATLTVPVETTGQVAVSECESAIGPVAAFDATAHFSQVNGKLIFRSSDSLTGPGAKPQAELELVISPAGLSYPFPADPAEGGIGGNPLVSLQLREGGGAEIGAAINFGRCQSIQRQ